MRKRLCLLIASGALALAPASATPAAMLGAHGDACEGPADRPAMLVRVIGLKARTGRLRVQSYGGDPRRFFDKGTYLERVDAPTPPAGPIQVCLPVPRPGTYAVSVRHDVRGTGEIGLDDGAGMSGNPSVSLADVIFRRKPSPRKVAVEVRGVTPVPVVVNYVRGFGVGPVDGGER